MEAANDLDFPQGPAREFVERTRGAYTYYSGDTPCVWFIGTRLTVADYERLYANPTIRAALEVLARAQAHAQATDPRAGGFDFGVGYTPPGTTIRVRGLVGRTQAGVDERPGAGRAGRAGRAGGGGTAEAPDDRPGDDRPRDDRPGDDRPRDDGAPLWRDEVIELVPGWRYSFGIGGRRCGEAEGLPSEERAWMALVAFAAEVVGFVDPSVAAS